MKAEKGAVLALVVALSTTGCSTVVKTAAKLEGTPVIESLTLPDTLPAAVGSLAMNVVQIDWPYQGGYSHSSGVRVTSTEMLTAGHVVYGVDEKADIVNANCLLARVNVKAKRNVKIKAGGVPSYGLAEKIDWIAGDYDSRDLSPDIALVATVDTGFTPKPQAIRLRATKLEPGEPVYFLNYQPDSRGNLRMPDDSKLSPGQITEGYSQPAEYGGIALTENNGQYVVATNLKSYGALPDKVSRGGASGGPVFDESGALVGVVSKGSRYVENVHDVGLHVGVVFKNIPGDQQLDYTVVDPITPQKFGSLRTNIQKSPACY